MERKVAVIIPAHNEAAVIAACLRGLLAQEGAPSFEAIVVANGCTDRTVAIAKEFSMLFAERGHRLQVIDLPSAGKFTALNEADRCVAADVRIYLDADTALAPRVIMLLVRALDTPNARLVGPKRELRFASRGIARHHGLVWQALPPMCDGVLGVGCYAVNRAGRLRWDRFPPLIADDGFVHARFAAAERVLVKDATATTPYPGFPEILGTLARWHFGNTQLGHSRPLRFLKPRFAALLRQPRIWPLVPSYLAVVILGRLNRWRLYRSGQTPWPRGRS